MDDTKVKVKIYGQEYIISGERDDSTIIDIADYVDQKMKEIGQFFPSQAPGKVATLAAVNITDELFKLKETVLALENDKLQLEKDAQHYMKMWDDAKKSFIQYKEGANRANDERSELEERYKRLEEKCAEFESSYFELQMENIQLRDKLEKMSNRFE